VRLFDLPIPDELWAELEAAVGEPAARSA
jgi:hypothetical protein